MSGLGKIVDEFGSRIIQLDFCLCGHMHCCSKLIRIVTIQVQRLSYNRISKTLYNKHGA